LITLSVDGSTPEQEKAIFNDVYYQTKFFGDNIEVGDWVVWVRNDEHNGVDACAGAAALAADAAHNDFIDEGLGNAGHDMDDHANHIDRGGLVRLRDLDGDGIADIFADVQLVGVTDGRVDEDPYNDDDDDTLTGDISDDATYTLCWSRHREENNDVEFTWDNPPTQDSQFLSVPLVQLHIMHTCV
tara:strand:+ start:108 stop:665 length:558 start_codon:yes stop_codon:yes gene_type:complete